MIQLAQRDGLAVTSARNALDFLAAVENAIPAQTVLSLDHDLNALPGAGDPGTGMDVVRGIAEFSDFAVIDRKFPGHMDVIRSGIVTQGVRWGFSLLFKNGELVGVMRRSVANTAAPDYLLPSDLVDAVLAEINVRLSTSFRIYS